MANKYGLLTRVPASDQLDELIVKVVFSKWVPKPKGRESACSPNSIAILFQEKKKLGKGETGKGKKLKQEGRGRWRK